MRYMRILVIHSRVFPGSTVMRLCRQEGRDKTHL
jgi:hypothetical protein